MSLINNLIEIIKKEFEKDFLEEPFHLLDFGCLVGIGPEWRLLEPRLRAVGIDINEAEVARLISGPHGLSRMS